MSRLRHPRPVTLRLPGGVRWRLTWRDRWSRWPLAVHRTTPRGRRTLVAVARRRWDGSVDLRPAHLLPRLPEALLRAMGLRSGPFHAVPGARTGVTPC